MKGLPFIFITALMALACGGSDSHTSASLNSKTTYRGKTQEAKLNKFSQQSLVSAIFGTFRGEFESKLQQQNDLKRLGLRFFLKKTQVMVHYLAKDAAQNQSYFSPSFSGLFGGKVDYSGNWDEKSGQIMLNFESFSPDGHNSWSEKVQVDFSHPSSGIKETQIIFEDFQYSTSSNTYVINGDMKHSYDTSTQSFKDTWNIHLKNDATEIKLDNYFEEGYKTSLEYTKSTFKGQFYDSFHGKINFHTTSTIECYGRTPCYGGSIMLEGLEGSKVKITPEGFGLLHFELDSNGDSNFESIVSQSHSEVEVY